MGPLGSPASRFQGDFVAASESGPTVFRPPTFLEGLPAARDRPAPKIGDLRSVKKPWIAFQTNATKTKFGFGGTSEKQSVDDPCPRFCPRPIALDTEGRRGSRPDFGTNARSSRDCFSRNATKAKFGLGGTSGKQSTTTRKLQTSCSPLWLNFCFVRRHLASELVCGVDFSWELLCGAGPAI